MNNPLRIRTFLRNYKKNKAQRKRDIANMQWFEETKQEFIKQTKEKNIPFNLSRDFPIFEEQNEDGGAASGHYFHQDLLVAHEIFKANPIKHLDIGSRVDGFVAHVASFREIEVLDIRHLPNNLININFLQADLMQPIPEKYYNYSDSVSSLHTIEHFGLGRYGDPIDAGGYLKGLENIYKILKANGTFYFSVPIGPQRVEFNAHRIFSLEYLLNYLSDKYILKSFSYVDDKGDLQRDIQLDDKKIKSNCDCMQGCGIFTLEKK